MKLNRDNDEYIGTPEEIAELIRLLGGQSPLVELDKPAPFAPDDFVPLEDVVKESQTLREKLAIDPQYNPYGGVVSSPETAVEQVPINRNQADIDTGVELL